ncbi:MAG: InlB B-repeat-containing protein, partial [Firmicutes bacterium]|nr:InlB B-repeat-containing protein [Bacillota bacterium]
PMTGATTFDRYYDQPVNANQLPTYNTANYTLDGWYFDAEYTEKAEFPLYLTGNATLFAKWIGRYVVTFESNGGSAVNPVTFTEGTELFNWPADPTKYGFLFAGWYTNEALTVLAGSAFVPTGNIKLYAKWMAKTPIDYDPAQAQTFSAGNYFTLMVNPAGGIWAWGENTNGKLGDGTTTARDTPVRIATGINFVVVSAGQNHSMAIDEFGGLWTWGSNGNGRLGLGSAGGADRLTPQPVTALSDKVIVAISAGHEHSLAIDQDGILYAWGNNGSGRLGLGGGTDRNAPQAVTISGGKKATSVSAGQEHSFVIDEDGTLWAFGANGNGRLGVGGDRNTPTEVMAGTKFSMAAAGYQHSAAIDKAGKLYAWGIGGRNGFATGGDRSAPAELTAVAGSPILGVRFVAVSAGQQHTAAIDEFGCLWTWGTNSRGQIGDGLFGQPRATPFEVVIKADAEAPKQQIAAVSAGYRHNLILCADGSFWKCGDWNGQLDNRPNLPSPFILPVPG